jgi:protein-S-isoprenylcysteine O-methyltransferase Ste14
MLRLQRATLFLASGRNRVASATIVHQPQYIKGFLPQHRIRLTVAAFCVMLGSEVALGAGPCNPLRLVDPWVATGTVAVLLGLLLRSWAAGMLVKKKKLASDGPYALVRHPLYLGSILLMLGFALLTGMWWNVAIAGAIALISFGTAIQSEERFLSEKFGDRWTNYAAQRGRLVPRSVAGNLAGFWNWRRWARNREFNAWIGAAAGWLSLLAWYAISSSGSG